MTLILDRLTRTKQVKPGSWMAACPCCESRRGRPLAVTETADGRTLIHAFCGCSTEDVLGRLGLTINDLFAAPLGEKVSKSPVRIPAGEVLAALSTESSLIGVIAADMLERKSIDEATWARLAQAVRRVGNARDYINERIK